jgi:hypothetical protein
MAQRGTNQMVLDQDYVVDGGELPYGPKCEVMLHHAEASLQRSLSFNGFPQFHEV